MMRNGGIIYTVLLLSAVICEKLQAAEPTGPTLRKASGSAKAATDRQSSPNIVFILADDLGWMDLASYAARVRGVDRSACYYETPNLDRLADQGMSFSQAYSCALCSPARASILTGQYAARHGFLTASGHTRGSYYSRKMTPKKGYHIHDRKENDPEKANPALGYITPSFTYVLQSGQPHDERDAVTIAEALKGYRSAMLGKWHLGALGVEGYQPRDQGFEELAYFDHGGSPYFDWRKKWQETGKPGADQGIKYLTDDLTERAVRFIRDCDKAKQPFFLYFPHFAVHAPREAKPEDVAYFEKKPNRGWNGHSMPEYAGVLRGLDNSVGRIVRTLDQLGITEDTLLIFMSDNGGIDRANATSNAPLRDGKASKYEGGVRVPLILRWPGRVEAGTVCDVPVDCNDMFPTILSVAGQRADLDGMLLDGQSLVPLFNDPKNQAGRYTRDEFFWHAPFGGLDKKGNYKPAHSAARKGDYKLLFDHQGYFELYNLANDISEEKNLAHSMPEKTQEIFALLNGWMNKTILPKYQPRANPLYDSDANSRSAAPPYRNLRKLPVETVSKPVVKKPNPQPNAPSLIRTWAKGKPQQKDGSFDREFVNPKGKTIVVLRRPDGREVKISRRVLTPDDFAYLKSITSVARLETNKEAEMEHVSPVRIEKNRFVLNATGAPFVPRGFNVVRLDLEGKGAHATFSRFIYDRDRVEAAFRHMSANGFNVVRVFINGLRGHRGCMFESRNAAAPDARYLDNLAEFLLLAKQHGILVVPCFDFFPEAGPYLDGLDQHVENIGHHSGHYLKPAFIDAKKRYLGDVICELRKRDPATLSAVFCWDLMNEVCFPLGEPPFSLSEGQVTPANGVTYDLATDKERLADDMAVYWIDQMAAAIRAEIPDALINANVFTYHAVGRKGPGDFHQSKAAWQNRYPFRPTALLRSTADIIDIHIYAANEAKLNADMASIEHDKLLTGLAKAPGKALIVGEFGVFKRAFPELAPGGAWAGEMARLFPELGFAGWIYWTYDSDEQEQLWNAMSGDAEIFRELME